MMPGLPVRAGSRSVSRLAATLFALWVAAPLSGADWPQWRGPSRDGRSAETGLALAWGEDGPPSAWHRAIGAGFSSVAVVDGRLYTAFASGDQEVVAALDAADGKELWRTQIGPLYTNERGGGPRSTPTVDGDELFVLSASGRLNAVALATGKGLWSRNLVGELGAEVPIWGFSASPLVVRDQVIVPVGGEGQAVASFHRADGRLLWSAHDDEASYSSAVFGTLAGREQVVVLSGQSVSGFSLDGEVLWSHPWPVINSINVATPLLIDDRRVFVSTSYDVGAVLLEVRQVDGALQVAEVWRDRVMKNHFQDSVRLGAHLFGFDNTILKCIEIETGAERWARRGFGKGQLLLVGDRLIVLGERGLLAVVEATPAAYRELAATSLPPQRYWTQPTLADGRLYVRTESDLFAFALDRALDRAPVEGAPVGAAPGAVTSAEELMRRNLAARGTEAAWREALVIRVSGRLNLNGRESEITVWRAGGDRVRWELSFLDRDELFVYDGQRAWYKSVRAGEGGSVAGPELTTLLALADSYILPRDPWAGASEVRYLGPSGAAGQHVLGLVVRGESQEWQLSPDDFQLVQARRGGDENPVEAVLLDWRPVAGLALAHYVEVSFGTASYSARWHEVEVLREIPAGLFEVPAG